MKKFVLAALWLPGLFWGQIKTNMEVFENSRGYVFDVPNQRFKSYANIDGSPYIDQAFREVTIEGYRKKVPALRYNAYEDEMEFMLGENLHYLVKQNELRILFSDLGKTYLLTRYELENKPAFGYLVELLGTGKYGLYKKEKIQIVENNNSTTNTYLKDKNPYFEREKDLYLIKEGGVFRKFPKTVKDLIALLHIADEQAVLDFAKANSLRMKEERDQIKILTFINSLP